MYIYGVNSNMRIKILNVCMCAGLPVGLMITGALDDGVEGADEGRLPPTTAAAPTAEEGV